MNLKIDLLSVRLGNPKPWYVRGLKLFAEPSAESIQVHPSPSESIRLHPSPSARSIRVHQSPSESQRHARACVTRSLTAVRRVKRGRAAVVLAWLGHGGRLPLRFLSRLAREARPGGGSAGNAAASAAAAADAPASIAGRPLSPVPAF
jgi:hypothetical protein